MTPQDIAKRIQVTRRRVLRRRAKEAKVRNVFLEQARVAVAQALQFNLRFCHVRSKTARSGICAMGGLTAVYYKPHNSSVITIAVANCSPKDVYCKAKGRVQAMMNWNNHARISLLLPKGVKPSAFINHYLFGYI